MALATFLGFPRMGAHRELKRALEQYWSGKIDAQALQSVARDVRKTHWRWAQQAGIDHIPSNDFSLYDQVLDTACTVGAIPATYQNLGLDALPTYFAMARGHQNSAKKIDVPALEMTKWFDTNYHYIVPQLSAQQKFALGTNRPLEAFEEAKALGIHTRPVILGPVSFLQLSKMTTPDAKRWDLLPALLPVYTRILQSLQQAGADWVQIDEPCLVQDLDADALAAYKQAYETIARDVPNLRVLLTTYFGALLDNAPTALQLPVAGIHLDVVFGQQNLDLLRHFPKDKILSLGVVSGRNIWRTDLDATLEVLRQGASAVGDERLWVASSCSLLHAPIDLSLERNLPDDVRGWLAFAKQKLDEIVTLKRAMGDAGTQVAEALATSRKHHAARQKSTTIWDPKVAERIKGVTPAMAKRASPHSQRSIEQHRALGLPAYPTTTIGSFPQTSEIRAARAEHRAKKRTDAEYKAFLEAETQHAIRAQEQLGLDVLVHGEFERNDMVGYFGEYMRGYVFSDHGWVQSYGSRCVKPPIIFGDVSRPAPMTVAWTKYAQSLTERPVKGMLTGPVTMLQWSFVRDDQPREVTCRQMALALRDEVCDLEAAGIRVIQIDEPALREGLPLRRAPVEHLLAMGHRVLPPQRQRRARRHANPYAHVLLGVWRHHRSDCGFGCRYHLHRSFALAHGAFGSVRALSVSAGNWFGCLRHSLATRSECAGDADHS